MEDEIAFSHYSVLQKISAKGLLFCVAMKTCNSSSWTKEEDRAFETALAIYAGDSNQLMKIAAAVPRKSIPEILQHYKKLVDDINDIEAGKVPLPQYGRMQGCSSRRSRLSGAEVERRKGVAWTAEEHRLFLQGLEKYGRGDWRSISRHCVVSRTPTQVASHAQKFFSRLKDNNKAKRRRSIHDITSVDAATTEPSQGQKTEKLNGPCGGQLQWPITDYVTEAFDPGMFPLPGPVTNCMTDAIGGPSGVNHENFPFGTAVVSELNSSHPNVDDEFLLGVEDLITVPTQGTSEAWHGVDTTTFPSLSWQPSFAGGAGMYTHPVNNVEYEMEELITKQLVEATQVGPIVNTTRLPLSIADHIGVHGCTASSSGAKNGFESTVGAPEAGLSVNSNPLMSIPGTSGGGVYPNFNASIKDDNIFDLEDLFPDHMIGFYEKDGKS
ncbi:uncharacterized protein LOC107790243 isoform X2 [Nicotiana tabacum]|uniref:Uncharacterized protein LOC107790243 isoform X2 n=1 Tax=Nicotiana tabacum TaxID=4097 RepID=A0A1S3ZTS0_TOBAC|nr:PREDICTED: uncharacterized protein LOC107790243 isoform X2 [Nicotiana tabacum]XP_018622197.1 uncharacterized protein LOC104121509 isoform X2 [Nicotiana tomentosiformis]